MAEIEKNTPQAELAQPGDVVHGDIKDAEFAALHTDIGLGLFEQSRQYDPAQLEQDAIKVRRKLDFIVLPMQPSLNYSNAYGLQEDTHMTGQDYSWVASALYFGWLVGAYPANLGLHRFPIAKFVGSIMFLWAALCMLQAAAFDFSGFFAIRFFLGFVEACVSPAWVLLTSSLWTREEQPLRTSFWISTNGVSSILGALLSWGLGHATGSSIPNWKLIYLHKRQQVVGVITFLWAIVILMFLPDGPHNGKMFSEYERVVAVWRISRNKTGVKHTKFLGYQAKEALLDPKTLLYILMGLCYGILNGSVANFMSALIKGFGFSALRSSLLQMPGGAVELVSCIILGYISTIKNMTGVTLIRLLTISLEHRWNLVACAWIQNFLGSPIVLSWTLPGLNVAGHTKRAVVVGISFCFYCTGNIIGPQLFFDDEAPRYKSAIKGLIICYAAAIVVQVIYTGTCYMQNKKRDRAGYHAQAEQEAIEGFEDLTDLENKHFRYHI
ncbi:putative mfs allantoate [Phaeomoniella chlamydospora]|uniref:Putative mfs allantoate n=1 Tax=Phaeomoniella chlamydospora TaxID=158046 RepID=A0A0G2ENQ8_PHACM|nr:putative mfs allantoate [Phaeomoniella chlamydospora]